MALKDDLNYTIVTSEEYVLLLEGKGIITNMSPSQDLKFRLDTDVPTKNSAYRVIKGTYSNNNSLINEDETSKIYGIAKYKDVQVLITREI